MNPDKSTAEKPTVITKEFLSNLKSELPRGYTKTLIERIEKKHNKLYSSSHIWRVLNQPTKKLPNKIIDEALILAAEHQLYLQMFE